MILIYCCKYYEIILYDSSVILPKLNISLTALWILDVTYYILWKYCNSGVYHKNNNFLYMTFDWYFDSLREVKLSESYVKIAFKKL